MAKKEEQIMTSVQFAALHGVTRVSVWKWMTDPNLTYKLVQRDAEVVEIAGKRFIRVKK
jgi:hypothetical protein